MFKKKSYINWIFRSQQYTLDEENDTQINNLYSLLAIAFTIDHSFITNIFQLKYTITP